MGSVWAGSADTAGSSVRTEPPSLPQRTIRRQKGAHCRAQSPPDRWIIRTRGLSSVRRMPSQSFQARASATSIPASAASVPNTIPRPPPSRLRQNASASRLSARVAAALSARSRSDGRGAAPAPQPGSWSTGNCCRVRPGDFAGNSTLRARHARRRPAATSIVAGHRALRTDGSGTSTLSQRPADSRLRRVSAPQAFPGMPSAAAMCQASRDGSR